MRTDYGKGLPRSQDPGALRQRPSHQKYLSASDTTSMLITAYVTARENKKLGARSSRVAVVDAASIILKIKP